MFLLNFKFTWFLKDGVVTGVRLNLVTKGIVSVPTCAPCAYAYPFSSHAFSLYLSIYLYLSHFLSLSISFFLKKIFIVLIKKKFFFNFYCEGGGRLGDLIPNSITNVDDIVLIAGQQISVLSADIVFFPYLFAVCFCVQKLTNWTVERKCFQFS